MAGERGPRNSIMAEGLEGSAILKVANDVAAVRARGRQVFDFTIGDFDPRQFPIPAVLRNGIEEALEEGQTNYPTGAGMSGLREAIRAFTRERLGLEFPLDSVLVTSGARPGIYGAFRTLVDPGDPVVYSVPSWQYHHYCQLVGARGIPVSCDRASGFLPTRAALEPVIRGARLLVLNSPLNPAGTVIAPDTLADICDLVLEENARRGGPERPLYLLYDQVYWMLTFGSLSHATPTGLRPAMAPYTVLVDAISKSFAATGLRVGWALGPADVIHSMNDFLGHVGTWAPRAEQLATAKLLMSRDAIAEHHRTMTRGLHERLEALSRGLRRMGERGLPVEATAPGGAIYLSARFDLRGRRGPDGEPLATNEAIRRYLLQEADFAAVPFQAFGVGEETGWFRLSVGAVSLADIESALPRLERAVERVAARPALSG